MSRKHFIIAIMSSRLMHYEMFPRHNGIDIMVDIMVTISVVLLAILHRSPSQTHDDFETMKNFDLNLDEINKKIVS